MAVWFSFFSRRNSTDKHPLKRVIAGSSPADGTHAQDYRKDVMSIGDKVWLVTVTTEPAEETEGNPSLTATKPKGR
jgi:hypothetical protein